MEWLYNNIGGSTPGSILPLVKGFKPTFRRRLVVLGVAQLLPAIAWAAESAPPALVKFNTAFIQGSDQPPELTEFLSANSLLPGTYRVDIFVNRALSGRRDVVFSSHSLNGRIEPCLTLEMLQALGLDPDRLQAGSAAKDGQACFDLPGRVEFARVEYQPNALRLNISVPQRMMQRSARGYVPADLWDEGEPVGFVNYAFNAARRTHQRQDSEQYYLSLRNGVNLGAWRLRNESSLVYGDNQDYRFRSNRTYLQRDISSLHSQFTLGETFTDSQIFDSVRFRGVGLSSDDGMLPDSERTYAPVIRGIAETNALVEVRQNGFLLYSGNVSPGPFEINDIYPSGSNGDLQVTVIEADGRRHSFTQAYASLPIMVPAGAFRYSLAVGQVDNANDNSQTPTFASAALIYGLSERITGFGGLQLAEDYRAGNIGAGFNTGLGALSADLTQSTSDTDQQSHVGHSLRLRYANTLDATSTTLAVAGYRYSTEQFRTLNEHVEATDLRLRRSFNGRAKDRLELNITQALPEHSGSLSLTASEQRYWNESGKTRQFYLAYNAGWRTLNYSLSLENNRESGSSGQSDSDSRIALSLTMPLGSSASASRVSFNGVRDSSGEYNAQLGLNGQMLDDRSSFYSVQAGHDSSSGSFGSGQLNTIRPYGRFEAGYSQGRDYEALSLGASGSVLVHGGGMNFGQSLGETFALVQVPNVAGAGLTSFSNVKTADNGYAVLPYAQPYRINWISLDTRQLGADVELDNAVTQIVPRRGAMPVVRFKAATGRRVQFELVQADGSRVPLGASVEDAEGKVLAVVDPTGRALVLSEKSEGELRVKWAGRSCRAAFALPEKDPSRAYERIKVMCQ
jgi:outer membrane usher protein